MLIYICLKNGMNKYTGTFFGILVFLLPPAQINFGWITNFVPGILNALIMFTSILIFPSVNKFLSKSKFYIVQLILSFFILLLCLFNYPPTAGFFLLPVMIRILYLEKNKSDHIKDAFYTLGFFFITCLSYFIIHKLYIEFFGQKLPLSSLYRFDISSQLIANFYEFFVDILPVMLNLWNPAPNSLITVSVISIIIFLLRKQITLKLFKINKTNILIFLWILMFFAINTPGLLASGSPPTFYRSWHPGMAVCLLVVFWSFKNQSIIRYILPLFLIIASFYSYNSSKYLSEILSNQFKSSVSQIKKQYNDKISRFLIIEQRPENKLFGFERWGELGFVHVLSRGHGIYILKKIYKNKVHREINNIVVTPQNYKILLEKDLLNQRPDLFQFVNKDISKLTDNRIDTFFETSEKNNDLLFKSINPRKVYCYKMYSDIFEPKRMPKNWKLYGSNDNDSWELLDNQNSSVLWKKGEMRTFILNNQFNFKYFSFKFNNEDIIRISEIRFFSKPNSCSNYEKIISDKDKKFIESLSLEYKNYGKVKFKGIASTNNLSDFPFRLQRSLDNIYYTFWETLAHFPINVDFTLFKKEKIKCYKISSGDDKANHRMPIKWKLLGSNDYQNWILLDKRENEINWKNSSSRKYDIKKSDFYKYYKLNFFEVDGGRFFRIYKLALSEKDCNVPF